MRALATAAFRAAHAVVRADRPFVVCSSNLASLPLSLADASVDPFPQQVGVATMAGVLLDHVDKHLAQRDGGLRLA